MAYFELKENSNLKENSVTKSERKYERKVSKPVTSKRVRSSLIGGEREERDISLKEDRFVSYFELMEIKNLKEKSAKRTKILLVIPVLTLVYAPDVVIRVNKIMLAVDLNFMEDK